MPASSASTTKQSPSNARNAKTGRSRTCRLSGDEFMRRFLQHVLPRGFHKVRNFGLWHPRQRHRRPGAADVATPGTTEARTSRWISLACRSRPPTLRQRHQSSRWSVRNSSGAADLHPHASAAAGYGTMIRSTHPRRNGSLLLPRAAGTPQRPLVSGAIGRTSLVTAALPLAPRPPRQAIDGSAQSQNTRRRGQHFQHRHHALRVKSP